MTDEALEHPESLDRTMARTVFSLAAMNGDAALYDKFFDRLKKAKTPEEYYIYLGTLTSFSDPSLLQRALEYSLTPEVRSQDTLGLIAGVMGNPAGERLAWDFVRAHWAEIDKANSGFISGELVEATSSFCDAHNSQSFWRLLGIRVFFECPRRTSAVVRSRAHRSFWG